MFRSRNAKFRNCCFCILTDKTIEDSLYLYSNTEIVSLYALVGGGDSVVGIATRYRLEGPGIESRLGTSFSVPVQTGPGAHPASYTMGTESFSRG